MARYRTKKRSRRFVDKDAVASPMLTQTIRQPDRYNAPALPSFGAIRELRRCYSSIIPLSQRRYGTCRAVHQTGVFGSQEMQGSRGYTRIPPALHRHGFRFIWLRYLSREAHHCSFPGRSQEEVVVIEAAQAPRGPAVS